ncbi:MAG: FIST C-terminal domain-containing protein [Myxococcales bacterium]|nr:FIST C-terminal domain-containing protein [Myxococcales bacterium]
MRLMRAVYTPDTGWSPSEGGLEVGQPAHLVLVFGSRTLLSEPGCLEKLSARHPGAVIFGCSTAGEIAGTRVLDDSLVATAIAFEHTRIQAATGAITSPDQSAEVGFSLAKNLPSDGLSYVFLLSDGLCVNGSELVAGLTRGLPPGVLVTGGLSADGAAFSETVVCSGGEISRGRIGVVGFYGDRLRVGVGSMGGWDVFGPERRITSSKANVLKALDGQPAIELYRTYLGPHAKDLPASGLLFPLAVRDPASSESLVRTILSIDESGGMVFAGDMPEGHYARLMRANFDRLVDGASGAARLCREKISTSPQLAILISCVGRKLVLNQRVEEEVEAAAEVLGPEASITGFYSYGEISPLVAEARCALHNQTMTITTLSEI